ncbi:serine hydrolase [Cellulomonas cellasea]|uniref:CubicO group peptidase (Beta-lactamase class C family) n=1 Tax=Cellulomonas cellasea TaxID=43670 RepID=A0A7W4UDP3_9CELL|nr:serine hydrolase domain-containing protein [Cellulomonas cellasea]MBB2922142.1 CubicO group peptidase (beta-lactamase class C family) [Cellulomonas cellasea]
MRPRPVTLVLAAAALVLGPAAPTPAAPTAAGPTAAAPTATPTTSAGTDAGCSPVTPDAAGAAFADVPDLLERDGVPGAVLTVVADGAVAHAVGYGVADLATGTPFDPDRSLVRIASVTKLLTATAVLQQVEAGRLDLDADVNRYLTAFRVPPTYARPVTVRDLLDHTAGFEERGVGIGARAAADVPPLAQTLARDMPARIYPPGEVAAYSNYGAALAGHLVEQVSGEPYAQYLQRHVLDPLGMTRTTAVEPVPAALAPDLARSYDSDAEPPAPEPFTFDRLVPDGSVSATATDMARFALAHLGSGPRVLDPATTARMHTRSFTADPRLPGSAHGFQERALHGRRALVHDGSWEGFQSALVLVPECGVGMFVSANATAGAMTLGEVVDRFAGLVAPAPRGEPDGLEPVVAPGPGTEDGATADARGADLADRPREGFYTRTRHNESTVERLLVLLDQTRLRPGSDGALQFAGATWAPQGEGLYRSADGGALVGLDGAGGRHYVATDGPDWVLLAAADSAPVNLAVVAGSVLASVTAVVVAGGGAWRRLRRRRPAEVSRRWRAARALTCGASLGGTAVLVVLGVVVAGDTSDFLHGVPTGFRVLLGGGVAVLAAALAGAALTVTAWRGSGAGLAARVHQVALLGGLGALAWFLARWNLIGWQLG